MPVETANKLGNFLRNRRMRLDPATFGFATGRRRTQGLRREEVAQRANISPTWYTWLEQGRGGAPSADVLNRIATGLMLTEPEREHLFMLGLGRPPEVRYKSVDSVTPRLQRVLDALETSPAIIKTATWDVVAWNRAAAALLTDYSKLPREQRNILRLMFGNPRVRAAQDDWQGVARFVVGSFRADAARAGAGAEIAELVEELSRTSPEFEALWRDNDLVAAHGEGVKRLRHPEIGLIELEFSVFAVDGRPELGMVVYNPVNGSDAERIQALIGRDSRERQ
ncbi:helix-turn-helix transcriptional regulator [Mesorhizobium sp. VK23B]|uniref:Helix-turn-helix transcriptional regulator n=1 Tax=Mesorhizobium dulcispinae TaxID=3072316 RepID=A0ABU4XEK7_9HYPH|nr:MULTISPECIES: helix-turn-helix transcriptional regulator [unclassified Mesorhizobium]MDX8467146.1 helix-turn-helix transcriptional regulator [Mesorhizobium sp. VK23B]MDX8473220.1 helix-turn-helix transcriptional regulator [Mesorhizobium sp. VK23A]